MIDIVIGSRADEPGQMAVYWELLKLGLTCRIVDLRKDTIYQYNAKMAVLLGDRYEVLMQAIQYRENKIPIAHIHAGEMTGQQPDDDYRMAISELSEWMFVPATPHPIFLNKFGDSTMIFNFGSPYITAAAEDTRLLIQGLWPAANNVKYFVAINPLPEDPGETLELCEAVNRVCNPSNTLIIAPNADRNREIILKSMIGFGTMLESLLHEEYIGLVATCDIMIGNTSAGLIEGSYFGTPYLTIGSRQKMRLRGPNARWANPQDVTAELVNGMIREGRKPNETYGTKSSAAMIATRLALEYRCNGKTG